MLDKRPHHARRGFRSQGDAVAPLVDERVHLLLHDVGGFARAFGEEFLAFNDGCSDFDVPVAITELACEALDVLPLLDLARNDVVGAAYCWNHALGNHYPA